jgi:hypothetical protein
VLPDRGMEAAVRLYAVIVRPLLTPRLLPGRRERRYAFPVLRILHHEPVCGLRQCHYMVALSEKMHPIAVEDLQHFEIGRHVVGVQEGLARDRYQLPIKDSFSDPIGAPVAFVPVVGPQHSFENRLELSLGVLGSEIFVSTRGHGPHPNSVSGRRGGTLSSRRHQPAGSGLAYSGRPQWRYTQGGGHVAGTRERFSQGLTFSDSHVLLTSC